MPVKTKTRHEFPREHPKAKPMFAKGESGEYPHRGVLQYATTIKGQVKASHGKTKTLSR